jgi:hypothetical protein
MQNPLNTVRGTLTAGVLITVVLVIAVRIIASV